MVAADVDGDNNLDIIYASFSTDNVVVLLNSGQGTFLIQVIYPIDRGSFPYWTAAADLNGDNKLDIIVANSGTSTIGVLLNTGNATFSTQRTYSTGYYSEPTSVVAADIDGDNKLDILVTNSAADNVGVFFNTGNGTFTRQTTIFTGSTSHPYSVVAADVNNDNKLDIIVGNRYTSNMGIFLNTGNGRFSPQTTYTTGAYSSPSTVVAADVNGGNKLDIILAGALSGRVIVFFDTGNGTFSTQNTYLLPGTYGAISAVAADVNDDSKLDIVISYDTNVGVGVVLNRGNGTFSTQTIYSSDYHFESHAAIAADVNGDNKPDIILAQIHTDNVNVLLNTGNGTFPNQTFCSKTTPSSMYSAIVADINNDDKPVIIVANYGNDNVGVLHKTDHGTFTIQMIYPTGCGSNPHSVVAADVNDDNKLDIIVANYGTNNIGVLLNTGEGMFTAQTKYSTGSDSAPASVVAADVNGDNKLDIIVANSGTSNVGVFLSTGNGTFSTQRTYSTAYGSSSVSVTTADINGDNKPDIIVANNGTNNVGVLLNTGNGNFTRQKTFSTGSNSKPVSVAAFDINDDNTLDIIVANSGANSIGVLLNTGNGTFTTQTTYSTGSYSAPTSVAAADVNGDNKLDIIVANNGTNNIGVLLNGGHGMLTTQSVFSIGSDSGPLTAVAADVNGDNKLDIIVANSGTNSVGILLNSVHGTFFVQTTYSAGFASSAVVADVDEDNEPDIIVTNHGSDTVSVLLNSGNSIFSTPTTFSTGSGSSPWSVVAADIDGDNKLDIVVANLDMDNVGVLLNTGSGTFSAQRTYSTGSGSSPWSVVAADVDGDSKLDIVVANLGMGNVGVLLNTGSGTFSAQRTYSTGAGSFPHCVVTADANGDNKLDIFVANSGAGNVGIFLNMGNGTFSTQLTRSTGYGSSPWSVVVVDVDGDNKPDIIVTNHGTNSVGVHLNTGNGSFFTPLIYSTGSVSLPWSIVAADVNDDNKPDIIVANAGTDNIGVFLNNGYGMFSGQTTYSTGFGSIPYSVVAADVNGDNKTEIIVANSGTNKVGILFMC